MYLISLKIQAARSQQNPDKPGKIYLKIIERIPLNDGSVRSLYRTVNTGIPMPVDMRIKDVRDELIPYIYTTYLVIDGFLKSGSVFTIDDVCEQLRAVIASEELKTQVSNGFVWDSEVATLNKELIPLFRYKKKLRRQVVSKESDSETGSLLGFLYTMSQKMLSEERESTSNSYISTRQSLKRFLGDIDISLSDIDHKFIEEYAEWLKETGVADSTQSFYLRTLRTGINYAAKEGLVNPAKDLFRNVNTKVRFDKIDKNPSHLSRETLLKIANMDLSKSGKLDIARDMFMFGFYCHGMELTDIIDLRTENIRENELTYQRRGTGKEINIRLDPQAVMILKKYENRQLDFLFPLKTSPSMKLDRSLKYQVATWLDTVGKMVGLESLTFKMNISTWNYLMSQANISSVLLET